MNFSIDNEYKKKNIKSCSNCNIIGHEFKECKQPIISLGVILLKVQNNDSDIIKILKEESNPLNEQTGIRGRDIKDLELYSKYKEYIKFLLIRRKHTLGYIEFVRGRYKPENVDGLVFLFQQMTSDEIKKINTSDTFEEIWNDLWGSENKNPQFALEFSKSKNKFEELRKNDKTNNIGLKFYVNNVSPSWDQAEWGFPKGRKNKSENNLECAMREFEEESDYSRDEYEIITNISPLVEEFIGTNGIKYKHIYYIGIEKTNKEPKVNSNNKNQATEIGAIGFYSYHDTIQLIRPYHVPRKKLVNRLYVYLMNKIINKLNYT
jgi:8-oxo-dGTP pyrophosphatase MutT (NUDIX family)